MLASAWATEICGLLSSLCHIMTLMPNLEFSKDGLNQYWIFRTETEAFPIFNTLFLCLNNFKDLPKVTTNFVSPIAPIIIWGLILGLFIMCHLNIPVERFIHSPELQPVGVFWPRVCKGTILLAASVECDPPAWPGEVGPIISWLLCQPHVSASSSEIDLNLCLAVNQKNSKDSYVALISALQSLPSCN